MVMAKNMMGRNLRQSIKNSLGRYIAIVAIIALGASMFVGLLMTKTDMVATGQKFMDAQNMFDLRLLSSYGWNKEHVEQVAGMDGVMDAEGLIYVDVIARLGESEEDSVFRFHALPETVNRIALRGGRMPESPNECLADGFHADDSILGTTVTVSQTNEASTLDAMVYETYTVVGYVATPLYMDMNRGTTSVGSGSLSSYFYIPRDGFDVDYYTEINITIPGDHNIYTDEYNDTMEAMADQLKPQMEQLAQERLEQVRQDAEEAYSDGVQEYADGLKDFAEGKLEAEQELADARQKLLDGEQEIKDNEQLLADGEAQIADAEEMLKETEKTLRQSKVALAESKSAAYSQLAAANSELMANYKAVNEGLQQVNDGLLEISTALLQVEAGILQIEQIDTAITQMDTLIDTVDAGISAAQLALDLVKGTGNADAETIARMEQEIADLQAQRESYVQQRDELVKQQEEYAPQLEELYAARTQLIEQQAELIETRETLEQAQEEIDAGFLELQNSQSQVDNQFAAAEAQLEAAQLQYEDGVEQLEDRKKELEEGKQALEDAKLELEEGWREYEDGKAELEQELADAEQNLKEAKQELADARKAIDEMVTTSVHILDRNSNIGYTSLDSSSDIVSGVSRVFPVFFLLVASLVCITTMTRMIDEERTQIGVLKAMGYSNGAIISKYLLYAGSGAVLGCGLGVLLGSAIFPKILWQAYCIMLYITPDVVLTFDWWLCGSVVAVYTAVMLLVTWYCCRRTLREEPAELIRPKAPEAGKKIFLEKLPIWQKLSFLNKVTVRNIFRYRQRLAMMMIGIGGCTALLMTGFGLRDSIVNVVDYQFEEVTVYDMTVYFTEGQTDAQQESFLSEVKPHAENVLFYHQSSIELEFDNYAREIYMISADDAVKEFINFYAGDDVLALPGQREVLLSVGVAEAMGIDVGDQLLLRNADMQMLDLTVSGIYENHVYNYAIVAPETIEAQWGALPEEQMAFVQVAEGVSPHEVSAHISGLNDVMNVSVSEDLAEMVGGMMDALDLVIIVIVVCAGLLAVIVLYNLTNININERIREIATIKVLGFNASETAAYIFKENLSLSVIGALLGLLLGKLLLIFVMSQIKINMVWFKAIALPMTYVWAIVLTILAAVVVDFVFYFKLEKINMAEALKSVE